MEKLILIKYGELTTKKDNRKFFVKTLENNIKNKLKDYQIKIESSMSRMPAILLRPIMMKRAEKKKPSSRIFFRGL